MFSPCWCFKCFSWLNGNNCLWLPGLKLIKIMKFRDAFLLWHLNGNESISWDSSGDHCKIKITVWTMPVVAEVKEGLWRCVSPVSDGQDCLYPKYPAHPANVVGLIGFITWGLKTYFSCPCGTCIPSGTEGFTILPLQIYLLPSFCLSHLPGLVFPLSRTAWSDMCRLIQ